MYLVFGQAYSIYGIQEANITLRDGKLEDTSWT